MFTSSINRADSVSKLMFDKKDYELIRRLMLLNLRWLVDSCRDERRSGVEADHRKQVEISDFLRGNTTPNGFTAKKRLARPVWTARICCGSAESVLKSKCSVVCAQSTHDFSAFCTDMSKARPV